MHRVEIARYLAKRIDGSKSGTAQNIVDTLCALADQVELLEHSLSVANSDCIRLAQERDEARREIAAIEDNRNDRRESPRPQKTH